MLPQQLNCRHHPEILPQRSAGLFRNLGRIGMRAGKVKLFAHHLVYPPPENLHKSTRLYNQDALDKIHKDHEIL